MSRLQKLGGFAAIYEAAAYIIGIVGFLMVVNISGIADPTEKVAAIVENQLLLSVLHLIVYVVWGGMMAVLSLALYARFKQHSPLLAQVAAAFGVIWAGLIIASGMIYNVGMETAVYIYSSDPSQAATVWLAIEAVFNGLGGGVEVVGGVWVLLLTLAAWRTNLLSKGLNLLGFVVSVAGIATVVPPLSEMGANLFGLTQIVWFAWLGIIMLRKTPDAVATTSDAVAAHHA